MTFLFYISLIILILFIFAYIIYIRLQKDERYQALKNLCNLKQSDITAFYQSYKKIFEDNSMISTLADYKQGKPPSRFEIKNEQKKSSEYTADCYGILNKLCALGNVKKMYIPKCMDVSKTLQENQILEEREVAQRLNVKKNGMILELGCGCGRIAHHISEVTQATVIGVNIDEIQLEDARQYSRKNNANTQFVFADFNNPLPFEDQTFDGIYSFGGFISFINDHDVVFAELYRILKPNGRIVLEDGVLLDKFDRTNKHHLKLMSFSRPLLAGGNFLHYKYYEDIGQKAGFKVLISKGGDPPNIVADLLTLEREHRHFDTVEKIINSLVYIGILPNYMIGLLERLRLGADDLIEMERKELLTMNWDYVFV